VSSFVLIDFFTIAYDELEMALQDSFAYISTGKMLHEEILRTPIIVNSAKKWKVYVYLPCEALASRQEITLSLHSQQRTETKIEKELVRICSTGNSISFKGTQVTTAYIGQYMRICFSLRRPKSEKGSITQKVYKIVIRTPESNTTVSLLSFESYKHKIPPRRSPRECGMRRTIKESEKVSYYSLFSRANAKTCPREWFSQIAHVLSLPSNKQIQEIVRISHMLEEQQHCQELPCSNNVWYRFQQTSSVRPKKIVWMLSLDRVFGSCQEAPQFKTKRMRKELQYVLNLYQVGVEEFERTMLSV
jgi:hypothetical protein